MESLTDKMKTLQLVSNLRTHIVDYFAGIDFNSKEHAYKYKGKHLLSVSATIKNYVVPFEADKIAGFVAKKRGISKSEVLQEWEDKKNNACNQGTSVHTFGENYDASSKPTNGFEEAIAKFWKDLPEHIVPVMFELQMFSEKLALAGTADIILYNTQTGKFIIADYKTNEDLFKNYKGKKLLYPFNNLLDSPINKYQIQLSLYQYLFEQCGFEVEDRIVIWLKPDSTYVKYSTNNYISLIIKDKI